MIGMVSVQGAWPPEEPEVSIPPHEDHVPDGDRESPGEVDTLGYVPDRLALLSWRAPEERDPTPLRLQDPEENAQQS